LKAVREFRGYIEANQNFIPNYGDRYRHGEKISTAFAESAVNQVVSKRMVKKQQMRWSEGGAHNLLQVRTQVLNDRLLETFVRWYPGMQTEQETEIEKKAA
jgi:predicted transcriptional regulator